VSVKGFVPTPQKTVDLMVARLFAGSRPTLDSSVLDPGCGAGAFIAGILRWCEQHRNPAPRIVGIDSNPRHAIETKQRFSGRREVEVRCADFLDGCSDEQFDFVIGNPPYVSILELSEDEKARYRSRYATAQGRFDLYLLFFEQALRRLSPAGRMVFITPEKYLYVNTAKPLRQMLLRFDVEEIRLVDESTFGQLVTYPTITTVNNRAYTGQTAVVLRTGAEKTKSLRASDVTWISVIGGRSRQTGGPVLADVCLRISAGVATGADGVFVRRAEEIDTTLAQYAYRTIAGRELGPKNPYLRTSRVMLVPYSRHGRLLPEDQLADLGSYLAQRGRRSALLNRTCVARKPWYAFHETPPLSELLRPKILCKDVTPSPRFWVDRRGAIVPRHSVYYIVPRQADGIRELCDYLNSPTACKWLHENCQRAATGFLRVQSSVLKRLPLPEPLARKLAGGIIEKRINFSRSARPRKSPGAASEVFEFAR
jgi:adenine-specific DNA-methyltransferase